jgi:hypothetical protein
MLGVKSYPKQYVKQCRSMIEDQLDAYRTVAAAAGKGKAETALDAFAPGYFNSMVVVLEGCFTHRLRGVEGKDGNPLNEVRVLATSILENDRVLTVEKSIKLKPETSVLGLAPGDAVALTEGDFAKLAQAYFDEIERKFVD